MNIDLDAIRARVDAATAEPQWTVSVSLPEWLPDSVRDSVFEAIAAEASRWEGLNRTEGWDLLVTGAPMTHNGDLPTLLALVDAQAARIDKALGIPDWGFDPDDAESIRDARLINATLGLVRRALTEDAQ